MDGCPTSTQWHAGTVGHDVGVTTHDGDALRQRCIDAVVDEEERIGRVAPRIAAVVRRQVHELVVHRFDLEAAAGVAHAPVAPELAAARVDRGAVTVVQGHTAVEQAHLQAPARELLPHLWGHPATMTADGDAGAEALLRGR